MSRKRSHPDPDSTQSKEQYNNEPLRKKQKLLDNDKNINNQATSLDDIKLLNTNESITLNIGGTRFDTTISTLQNQCSVLSKMFCGNFAIKPNSDGSFFIDRDGTHFRFILNYLRDNKLNLSSNTNIIPELLIEAEFYQINGLINLCESYHITSNILTEKYVNKLRRLVTSNCNLELNIFRTIHKYDSKKYSIQSHHIFFSKYTDKTNILMIFNLKNHPNEIFGFCLCVNPFIIRINRLLNQIKTYRILRIFEDLEEGEIGVVLRNNLIDTSNLL